MPDTDSVSAPADRREPVRAELVEAVRRATELACTEQDGARCPHRLYGPCHECLARELVPLLTAEDVPGWQADREALERVLTAHECDEACELFNCDETDAYLVSKDQVRAAIARGQERAR